MIDRIVHEFVIGRIVYELFVIVGIVLICHVLKYIFLELIYNLLYVNCIIVYDYVL